MWRPIDRSLACFARTLRLGAVAVVYMAAWILPAAQGQKLDLGPPEGESQQTPQPLQVAVEMLMADADRLGAFKLQSAAPVLKRPHPAVTALDAQAAQAILDRMRRRFTGNDYKDTYIRWHLFWVLKEKARPEQRRLWGKALMELVDMMPPPAALSERDEYRFEPEEIYKLWYRLYESSRVVVGIPPYEKRYSPPQSFDYMSPKKRKQAKINLAKAEKLRGDFRKITDRDAIRYNKRIRFVNWVVRQYRGELIYALISTGDPKMARAVVRAIDRHARSGTGIALDLLNFLYKAAWDGALELYDPDVRTEMSRRLRSTAKAVEGWREYGGQQRNFADYAFHMVHLLKDDELIDEVESSESPAPESPDSPDPTGTPGSSGESKDSK